MGKHGDLFRWADKALRRGLVDILAQELWKKVSRGGAAPWQLGMETLRLFGREFFPVTRQAPEDVRKALENLWEVLGRYVRPEPSPQTRPAHDVEEDLAARREGRIAQPGTVMVPMYRGVRAMPADHPLVTGDMVPVESSNVHSVGYDLEHRLLYVRYLDAAGRAGPLYGYHDVMPDEFLDFLDAPSKGRWVWDHLRERGTVAGYRKAYFLAGITRGYVPRHAVLAQAAGGLAEVYRPRTAFVGGRWRESRLPLRVVRTLQVVKPPGPVRLQRAG